MNLSSLTNNNSTYKTSEVRDISKNTPPSSPGGVDKLKVSAEKSPLGSVREKRANTIFTFRKEKSNNFEKSNDLDKSDKPSNINYEGDGSICLGENEKSAEHSEEENDEQLFYSDFDINSGVSPRSNKLDSSYRNKINSAQVLASMTESDGALLPDNDKKPETKVRRPQFRLPTLSFSKNTEAVSAESGSVRSGATNSSRHLSLFTSGIRSPRSTQNEADSVDGAATSSSGQALSPRGRQSDSDNHIASVTPRLPRTSVSNIFGSAEIDPAEKQREIISRISKFLWRISNKSHEEKNGKPLIERISSSIRNLLAADYRNIASTQKFQSLALEERDIYLKQELGARLISHVLREQGDNFDPALLGSFSKLSGFLKNNFGITFEKQNAEKELQSYKSTGQTSDLLQIILDDVIFQSVNANS